MGDTSTIINQCNIWCLKMYTIPPSKTRKLLGTFVFPKPFQLGLLFGGLQGVLGGLHGAGIYTNIKGV